MDELAPDSAETYCLLARASAGDRRAFAELFARYRPDLCRFIEFRLDAKMRGRLDASDVVQETQLEAFQRLADFLQRRPMPFHVWLRKTVYERLLMLRRQHVEAARRAVGCEVPLPDRSSLLLAQRFLPAPSSPSRNLNRRELARRVHQLIAQLPDADREILIMRDLEERSYKEVACILELEPAAARKRHGRALLRFHALLTEAGLTESQL